MLQPATLKFLKDLKKNNNRPWFESNRAKYQAAKNDVEQFFQSVIDAHSKKDASIKHLKAKECMFRINRDVRFTKDKSPYKINFGVSINRGGKKSMLAGYYFHLQPGESFVGGGVWMPMPPELKKLRQEIDYNLEQFRRIIGAKKFKSVYGKLSTDEGGQLRKVPQGFDKANPAAEYLKLKSYIVLKKLPDAGLVSARLKMQVLDAFQTLQPLIEFLNKSLSE